MKLYTIKDEFGIPDGRYIDYKDCVRIGAMAMFMGFIAGIGAVAVLCEFGLI